MSDKEVYMYFYNGIHFTDSSALNNDGKPVMVFLHGFFMDCRMFNHQVEYFQDRYRVICCDLRGFGQTKWDKREFSLEDVVEDVVGLLDHLHIDNCILGGMSMGGYIAQRLVLKHPKRFNALIFMATQSTADNPETVRSFHELRDNWSNELIRSHIIESLLPVIIGTGKENIEYWRSVWNQYSSDNIYYPMNAMTSRKNIDVTEIYQAALVIHGTEDQGIPHSAGMALSNALQHSQFVSVEGAYHAVNLSHPNIVNKAIESFLLI